jgi:Tfp pilus assembly protein PilF
VKVATALKANRSAANPPIRVVGMRLASALWIAPVLLGVSVSVTSCTTTTTPSSSLSASQLVEQGLNAQSLGQTQQAQQDYQAAVAKDPTNKYAFYDLGVIYQQENDATNASMQYHKALVIDPNYKPALFNLAVLETPTNPQGAIALYQLLLQLNPSDANVNFNLGLILIANTQSTQGHADLQKAIQINPALRSRLPAGITP